MIFKTDLFDCYSVYGWVKHLRQWHLFTIVIKNGKIADVDMLKQSAELSCRMIYGETRVIYVPKNTEQSIILEH